MTLKEIVITLSSCVIITAVTVLAIEAGKIFDNTSQTITETKKTLDVINVRRQDICDIIDNIRSLTARLPGCS